MGEYFDIDYKMGRQQYWERLLFLGFLAVVGSTIESLLKTPKVAVDLGFVACVISTLFVFAATICLYIQRANDVGMPRWSAFLLLIPGANVAMLLLMGLIDKTQS